MIVKKNEAFQKSFHGVNFEVLAKGEQSMITKMKYAVGNKVPFHAHPNEQSGYVISGRYRIVYLDYNEILSAGDSYSIPENVAHSLEVIEEGEVIDVFTPPRADY
jgi:quercetin dioxygenase-like cupin family protein